VKSGVDITKPQLLKYAVELSKLANCPPPTKSEYRNGFRFAHSRIDDLKNFQPVAIRSPSRLSKLDQTACCSAYALSMFDTLENLLAKAKSLRKSNPQILKSIGDHAIELQLDAIDGRHTVKTLSTGHFDFHEFTDFNAATRVLSHAKLEL
jgi:hypothetical protein